MSSMWLAGRHPSPQPGIGIKPPPIESIERIQRSF
jgi:hypothetical protein